MDQSLKGRIADLVTFARNCNLGFGDLRDLVLKEWLSQELQKHGNNQCTTAAHLGIHRNTLHRLIERTGTSVRRHWKSRKSA
jgi:DNA-binding NtrC family response regulator